MSIEATADITFAANAAGSTPGNFFNLVFFLTCVPADY